MITLDNKTVAHLVARLAPRVAEHLARLPRSGELAGGDPDQLINEIAAAAILGLRPTTLTKWRSQRRGPAFRRLGQGHKPCVRYRHGDVIRFRDARAVTPGR